jgi:hypothetical protein
MNHAKTDLNHAESNLNRPGAAYADEMGAVVA